MSRRTHRDDRVLSGEARARRLVIGKAIVALMRLVAEQDGSPHGPTAETWTRARLAVDSLRNHDR